MSGSLFALLRVCVVEDLIFEGSVNGMTSLLFTAVTNNMAACVRHAHTHTHSRLQKKKKQTARLLRSFPSQRNAWRCIQTHTHRRIKIHPPTRMHVHMMLVAAHQAQRCALIPSDSNEINPQCAKASLCLCVCVCVTDMFRA